MLGTNKNGNTRRPSELAEEAAATAVRKDKARTAGLKQLQRESIDSPDARSMYRRVQQRDSSDFSDVADMNVEAEADAMDPIKIEGVAPTKAEVTGVDRDKVRTQSAPTFGTQYSLKGGKVRFSPKGDLYVYEYDPKTREYTVVDGPGGVGAKFGADHPSIAKFDESRMAAQQESGVTPPEELAIEGDAGVDPDSLTPAEFRERYGFSQEEAEGVPSGRVSVSPGELIDFDDFLPEETLLPSPKEVTEDTTDPQSPALRAILFEGPQPIVDKEGVLYTHNVRNALMTGKLDIDEWPKIKQRLQVEGAIKTQIGADPTTDTGFRARILAAQAASRAMRLRGYRG